jgi:lipopolysaccharide/colanic/teichoic acid biosynthesis glycosyltransferase/glycosyltransferase involved in cell wall biosynthesis
VFSSLLEQMDIQENSFDRNRIRAVDTVTASVSVRFLEGRPEYFVKKGYEVTVVSSAGEDLRKAEHDGVRTVAVPMAREISPWKDLVSLWRLLGVMRRLRPTITNVATPKAGLLGGIAAWLCAVPCRYYTLLGLRCETTTGFKRKVLVMSERIACACAHRVICVSESLRQTTIQLGIVDAARTVVLASGSFVGTDPKRFASSPDAEQRAGQIRWDLGISMEAPVVGFVGRLTKDKGISELVQAYLTLRANIPELRLLLVGGMEEGDPLPAQIRRVIESEHAVISTGFVQDPADYYHVMDVFAFPTHREGFGNVVLEAHAAGKPVVAARATGAVDAVIDGVTGILVPVGDSQALASALELVIRDRSLAAALGRAGRERVLCEFQQETVWDALAEEYLQFLQAKGLTVPTAKNRNEATPALKATGGGSAMSRFVKRLMDISLAGSALLLASPLMALIALTIRRCEGRPVLFRQMRPGYKGKLFTLLKFRTMRDARDAQGMFLPDAERLTPIGMLLRQLSLDELPQLWNVLRGEMSLVGPRPLLMQYMDRYSAEQLRRHDVKPGITGWAQVHGRNARSWTEKFDLDLWYVNNWSLALDAWVLLRTPWQLVKRNGISQQGHVTMPEFLGSERSKS